MRSESGNKPGHTMVLRNHNGACTNRSPGAVGRGNRITHSHKVTTCRQQRTCPSTELVGPSITSLCEEDRRTQSYQDMVQDQKELRKKRSKEDLIKTLSKRSHFQRTSSKVKTMGKVVLSMKDQMVFGRGYAYKRDSLADDLGTWDDVFEDAEDAVNDVEEVVDVEAIRSASEAAAYDKICRMEGVTPCGRFLRQMNDVVADISHGCLGTKDIKSICVLLSSNVTIKELDLSGNDLSGKGATYVAEALRENTTATDISMSECNIDLDGFKAICKVLLEMKPLKRIDLSKNQFGRNHAEELAEVMKRNDYIEELVLSGNQFDNVGGTVLGKALMSNVGLKKLDLSWNHLRREGATAVCMALRHNTTLEELDLSWNGLAEEGCKALGVALPCNHTLKELDITCNRISPFALKYLLPGLEKNDSLKTLRVCQNPLTTEGAIVLMKYLTKSTVSQISNIHMIDIPINDEFLTCLDELLKVRPVKVYHRDPNKKKITPIVRQRTLKDYDPAMILFEYMKQENLRLIDLFRTFDADGDMSVSKDELREGFVTINMPLTDDALDSLFERLDINENDQIEYDEVKSGYRKTMAKLRGYRDNDQDKTAAILGLKRLVKKALVEKRSVGRGRVTLSRTHNAGLNLKLVLEKMHTFRNEYKIGYRKTMRKMRESMGSDNVNEVSGIKRLKGLVHKALEERRDEKLLLLRGKRRQRQASLTAVFRLGSDDNPLDMKRRLEQMKARFIPE